MMGLLQMFITRYRVSRSHIGVSVTFLTPEEDIITKYQYIKGGHAQFDD